MADPVTPPVTPAATTTTATPPAAPPATAPAAATPPVVATPAPAVTPPAAEPTKVSSPDPANPEPVKPVVPEKYDLKTPEGSPLAPADIERISLYAKEKGLSNETAQVLLNRESEQVVELKNRSNQWVESLKADKEFGGEAFTRNVEHAHRALKAFAPEGFIEVLERTGLGNHPDLVRTFSKIGAAMSEDQLVIPGAQAGGVRPIEEVFYPTMGSK